MKYLIGLAIKSLKRHPVQSLLTILGISLSVAIILAVFMVNSAMKKSVEKTAEELGTGKTGIWVQELTEDVATIGTKQEGFSMELLQKILQNNNVSSVHPSLKVYTTIKAPGNNTLDCYIYGIRFSDDSIVRNHVLTSGSLPENDKQILIGKRLADNINARTGSWITIPSPNGKLSFQISGILSASKGTGTLNNNDIIFGDLNTIQKYFNYESKITSLNIVLKQGIKPTDVLNEIKSLLPANVTAFTDPIMDVASSDSTEKLRIMAFIFAFISVFIAVFVIYNTLSSSVEQNRKEIGLLRLIGMTNKQIIRYFISQSLVYSIIGSVIGVFFGLILGTGLLYLVNLILKFQSFFVELPSVYCILFSAAIGIVTTVIVGIFPAIKASKISPIKVLRNFEVEEDMGLFFTKGNYIGSLVFIAGLALSYFPTTPRLCLYLRFFGHLLLFIGICMLLDFILPAILKTLSLLFSRCFGVSGFIAVQSLILRLKRTVITIGSITVAVAIFIGFMGSFGSMKNTISNWYDNTKWADILIFSTSGAEINESILNTLGKYEFTEKMNPMRYRFIPYKNEALSDNGFLFQGINPVTFQEYTGLKVNEGNTDEIFRRMQNEHIILINENLAKTLGVKQGDYLKLNTAKGIVDFQIAGSISDYSDFVHRLGKVVYGSCNDISELWEARGYTVIQIHLKPGYTQQAAKTRISDDLSSQYNIKVITHDEEKKDVSSSVDQIFSIIYALNLIIFIIVFMGVFNTVLINVFFQIREFAVLRTIGCFARQIRTIVILEAVAMSIVGGAFALFAGLWFANQLTIGSSGIMGTIIKNYLPVATAIILLILTVFISIAATIYPQRIATKASISGVMQSIDSM